MLSRITATVWLWGRIILFNDRAWRHLMYSQPSSIFFSLLFRFVTPSTIMLSGHENPHMSQQSTWTAAIGTLMRTLPSGWQSAGQVIDALPWSCPWLPEKFTQYSNRSFSWLVCNLVIGQCSMRFVCLVLNATGRQIRSVKQMTTWKFQVHSTDL